jgi:hypothetical protein
MRNPEQDGSEYYGPYAGVRTMKTVLQLTHKLYKLRTCSYDLSPKNIAAGQVQEVPGIPHRELQSTVRRACKATKPITTTWVRCARS